MIDVEQYLLDMQELADKHAKYIKLAFLAAILELKSLIDYDELVAAFDSNNFDAIMAASHIDELENLLYGIGMDKDTFIFSDEVHDTFNAGAVGALFALPTTLQKPLNYNPLYETTVKFFQSDITNLTRDIVAGAKGGIYSTIARGSADQLTSAVKAGELKSLIGLTAEQTQAVLNFKRQLETRQILGFTPPDNRRLDILEQTLIREHMKNGTFSTDMIDEMVNKYYESLLNKRALDIANTESMNAVNNGQQALWEQGLDAGVFSDETTRKFWITAGDEKVRMTHRAIPGMNPNGVKIKSMFITPFGLVSGPGTRTAGFINCRCSIYIAEVPMGGFNG